MAYPQIVATTTSLQATATTNHTVNLPTPIASGELLAFLFGIGATGAATVTLPGGWTKKAHTSANNTGAFWAYRVADGTEGASISVTTSATRTSAHRAWRIQGHSTTTNPPEDQGFWSTNAGSTAPDPPALTPTGGAKDYLWLAFATADSGTLCTVAPTNYMNLETNQSGTNANVDTGISSARRELNAASNDPGTFTLAATEAWLALTTAIHPGSEGLPGAVVTRRLLLGVGM